MFIVIMRRLISGVIMLLTVSLLAHLLMLPGIGNVARNVLGEAASAEQVAAKAHELGLDQPFIVWYGSWLSGAFRGDLGTSYFSTQSVADAIATRLPVTASILVLVTLCTGVVSFAVGMTAAVRRGWADRLLQFCVTIGDALPAFLIGLFLVTLFAVQLRLFPATGFVPLTVSVGGWLLSVTLPVVALTITSVAGIAQHVRSSTLSVLRSDYVRTRRSRGLSSGYVLGTSVLRNSAATGLTALAVQITAILGGAVVIEQVFALPGLGSLAVQSAVKSDLPMVIGVLMVFVVIVIVVNLLVDIAVAWVNPKVRLNS